MHEWALAEAVVNTLKNEGAKEAKIIVGELQQIDLETFEFALKENLNLQGLKTKIKVEREKALLKCKVCGHEWPFLETNLNGEEKESIHFIPETAHVFIRCPKCGSSDFEVVKGRGVWIDSIVRV